MEKTGGEEGENIVEEEIGGGEVEGGLVGGFELPLLCKHRLLCWLGFSQYTVVKFVTRFSIIFQVCPRIN